jgi:hypothetical protein
MAGDSLSESIRDGLHGEPEQARDRAEARLWADTYSRLISMEENVLEHMRELADREPLEVRVQIQATNITPMVELIDQLKERARNWSGRHLTLLADEPSQGA